MTSGGAQSLGILPCHLPSTSPAPQCRTERQSFGKTSQHPRASPSPWALC